MPAYRATHPKLPPGRYAVMDLGGGTLDITVVEVGPEQVQVVTTEGDRRLGGTDFSQAVDEFVRKAFREQLGT